MMILVWVENQLSIDGVDVELKGRANP
jgi:hypothetical protein